MSEGNKEEIQKAIDLLQENGFKVKSVPWSNHKEWFLHKFAIRNPSGYIGYRYHISRTKKALLSDAEEAFYCQINLKTLEWTKYK